MSMGRRVSEARRIKDQGAVAPYAASAPRGQGNLRVAFNLKHLRMRAGLTLGALAEASGLSVHQIARIEHGRVQPTIKELWSLATALEVPFSAFLAPEVAHITEKKSEGRGYLLCRPVLPTGKGPSRTEVYELRLSARGSRTAPARPNGTVDSLLVSKGRVKVQVRGVQHVLEQGETVEIESDAPRIYTNLTDDDATMFVKVTYAAGRK
jgi:transcriptional regulator with XRE-family HTH domain